MRALPTRMTTTIATAALAAGVLLGSTATSAASAAPSHRSTRVEVQGFTSELIIDGKAVAQTVSPNAFPSSGSHAFTPQAPGWSFSDAHGSGTEQIKYGSTSSTGLSEQWGYKLSAASQATVDGNVGENATLYCGSKVVTGYGKHTEPADYHFHGSKGSLSTSCNYHTAFGATWTTENGGKATLQAQWNWVITYV